MRIETKTQTTTTRVAHVTPAVMAEALDEYLARKGYRLVGGEFYSNALGGIQELELEEVPTDPSAGQQKFLEAAAKAKAERTFQNNGAVSGVAWHIVQSAPGVCLQLSGRADRGYHDFDDAWAAFVHERGAPTIEAIQ